MLVVVVALVAVAFVGVRTYMRYSNPLTDITASYYEKTSNSTTVIVGDVVEVKVLVGWHGYVIPEFKRNVKIVDPFPESFFSLASGSNVYESTVMEEVTNSLTCSELSEEKVHLRVARTKALPRQC